MLIRGFLGLLLVAWVGASYYGDVKSDKKIGILPSEMVDTYKTCNVGELFCSEGCDLLLLCLANYDTTMVRNCSETAEYMCDSRSLQCLHRVNATCERAPDEGAFPCHATGLFPNPYDCRSYFTCTSPGADGIKQTCSGTDSGEYGYDPLYNTCSYTMKDRVCVENPIPVCASVAQSGAQIENPNIYYICMKDPESGTLVPWLFRCNRVNEVFDDVTKECAVRVTTTAMSTTTTEGGANQNHTVLIFSWLFLIQLLWFLIPYV